MKECELDEFRDRVTKQLDKMSRRAGPVGIERGKGESGRLRMLLVVEILHMQRAGNSNDFEQESAHWLKARTLLEQVEAAEELEASVPNGKSSESARE